MESTKVEAGVECFGFNIENGAITAKKIYYKRKKAEGSAIDREFVRNLLSCAKGLRFFSEENASLESGIVKYDFQVDYLLDWVKARHFLKRNAPFYHEKIVASIEQIPWLRTTFSTIGIRYLYERIINIELYYRRYPQKRPSICRQLRRLLPMQSATECQDLMRLMLFNGAWVQLVGIDFSDEHQYIKIYFNTQDTDIYEIVKKHFETTSNFKPFCQITEQMQVSNAAFAGIAIVMDVNSNNLRYNFYFSPPGA